LRDVSEKSTGIMTDFIIEGVRLVYSMPKIR